MASTTTRSIARPVNAFTMASMPASSLAYENASPVGMTATSNLLLLISIPTNIAPSEVATDPAPFLAMRARGSVNCAGSWE